MRSKYFIVSLLSALCAFSSSSALGAWESAEILDIRAFTKQSEHYISVSNFSNPDNCQAPGALIIIRDDADNWRMVHSLLLTGIISGKSVEVRTAGCHPTGHPIIDGARIIK